MRDELDGVKENLPEVLSKYPKDPDAFPESCLN